MKRKIIDIISELASSQHGLLTTAQAERFGVSRNAIAYLAKSGRIERLVQGVYIFEGAPRDGLEDVRAAWMATQPESMTYDRIKNWDGIAVGGRTAAAIHDIGDFYLSPFEFYTPKRINSRRQDLKFTTRVIDKNDVDFSKGLPVTSVTRTIFDLRKDHEDTDLLNKALIDAIYKNGIINSHRLERIFAQDASQLGGLSKDAYSKLFSDAGLEMVTLEEGVAESNAGQVRESKMVIVGSSGELIPLEKLLSIG